MLKTTTHRNYGLKMNFVAQQMRVALQLQLLGGLGPSRVLALQHAPSATASYVPFCWPTVYHRVQNRYYSGQNA